MFPSRKKSNSPTRQEIETATTKSSLTTTRTRPSLFRASAITSNPWQSPGSHKSVKESLGRLTDTVATSLLPDIKITNPEMVARGQDCKSTFNQNLVRQGKVTGSSEPPKGIAQQFNELAKTHVTKPAPVFTRKVAPCSASFGRGSKNICGTGSTYRRVDKACQLDGAKEDCTIVMSPAKSVEIRQRNMVMAKIKFYEGSISDDSVMSGVARERTKSFQDSRKKKPQLSLPVTSDRQLSDVGQITRPIETSNDFENKNDVGRSQFRTPSKEEYNVEQDSEAKFAAVPGSKLQSQEKDLIEFSEVKKKNLGAEKEEISKNRTLQLLPPSLDKIEQSTFLTSNPHSESPKSELPSNFEKQQSNEALTPVVTDCTKLSRLFSETADAKDIYCPLHVNRTQKQFLIGQHNDKISVITTTKYDDVAQEESSFTDCWGEVVKAMVTPPTPEDKQKNDNIFMKEERSQSDSAVGQKVVGHASSEQDENPKDWLRLNTYDAESRRGSDCTGLKRRKTLISPRRVVSLKQELPKKR